MSRHWDYVVEWNLARAQFRHSGYTVAAIMLKDCAKDIAIAIANTNMAPSGADLAPGPRRRTDENLRMVFG